MIRKWTIYPSLLFCLLLSGMGFTASAQSICDANPFIVTQGENNLGYYLSWTNNFSMQYAYTVARPGLPPVASGSGLFYSVQLPPLEECAFYVYTVTSYCADGGVNTGSGSFWTDCVTLDPNDTLVGPPAGNVNPGQNWDPVTDPTGGDPDWWANFLNGQDSSGTDTLFTSPKRHVEDLTLEFNISPNPSTGNLRMEWNLGEEELESIEIRSLQGRLVRRLIGEELPNRSSGVSLQNLSDLPDGIYLLSLRTEDQQIFKKLSLLR